MNILNPEKGHFFIIILVLIITFIIERLVRWLSIKLYKKLSNKLKINPGKFFILHSFVSFTIFILGVSYAISFEPQIKSLSTSLLASAGIATAIVGFAAKDILANFVSGIVIILFQPFTVTHWINVENVHEGYVEEIKVLYTVIRDKSQRRTIIPNSKIISSNIVNSSYRNELICQYVEFKISYSSDIKKAKEIIRTVAEKHPFCIDNRTPKQKKENFPKVEVRLLSFGDYSINLRALVWVKNPLDARTIRWVLNEPVKEEFDKNSIEIPFPYRNLIIKKENTSDTISS